MHSASGEAVAYDGGDCFVGAKTNEFIKCDESEAWSDDSEESAAASFGSGALGTPLLVAATGELLRRSSIRLHAAAAAAAAAASAIVRVCYASKG